MGKLLAAAVLLLGVGVVAAPAFGINLGGCGNCSGNGGFGGQGGSGNAGSGWGQDDYSTALRAMHHKDYDVAIPYLENALRSRPKSAEIMNDLGLSNRMVGNYRTSLTWLQKALVLDPDHKKAHENLGELNLAMQDPVSAQAQLAELVRLCPDSCDERDDLTKAIADYQAAHPAAAAAPPGSTAPAQMPPGSR
jgi:tetratricopeptide (TPR) repeat protein